MKPHYQITPYLTSVPQKYRRYDIYDDQEKSLEKLRRLIYNGENSNNVLFITNNYGNRYIPILYQFRELTFKMVIRSSIALSDYENSDNEYGKKKHNNTIVYVSMTPMMKYVYSEAQRIIEKLKPEGNAVILGPKEGRTKNIYYVNNLSKLPSDVSLVIDTMLNDHYDYILLGESLERYYSFTNVTYYRMMNQSSYNNLRKGREPNRFKIIMEAVKYGYDPSKIFDIGDVKEMSFHMDRLKLSIDDIFNYPYKLLPSAFLHKWSKSIAPAKTIKRKELEYVGKLFTILLDSDKYLLEILNFPLPTEDGRYNFLMDTTTRDKLLAKFGENKNIAFYLTIFNEASKNTENIVEWCYDNNINYKVIKSISDLLDNQDLAYMTIDVYDMYLRVSKVLIEVYGFLKSKKSLDQDIYFDSNNNEYRIDLSNAIVEKERFPKYIIPFVMSENKRILMYNGVKPNRDVAELANTVDGRLMFPNVY